MTTGTSGARPRSALAPHLPSRRGDGDAALRAAGPGAFSDAIDLLGADDRDRLARYAKGGYTTDPQPGFWAEAELIRPDR